MRAVSATTAAVRHVLLAAAEGLVVAAIAAAFVVTLAPVYAGADLFAGSADARGSDVSITVPDGQYAGTTTALILNGKTSTWARARCYQAGAMVSEQWVKSGTASSAVFTLGPTRLWSGGTASCSAEVGSYSKNGNWRVAATTKFMTWD